jgi:hypothetical protein
MQTLVVDHLTRIRELWPVEKFLELGLPPYVIPKNHGVLPEGSRFDDFSSIAKAWMENALLFSYRDVTLPRSSSLIIFTWVMADGLGDWSAAHAAASVLKKAMPDLSIELITLVETSEKKVLHHPDLPCHILSYTKDEQAYFPPSLIKKMANASLILQLPTFYPHFQSLVKKIEKASFGLMPTFANVGEYGFINSEWFHPKSGNLCMGIHPLEKGLLLDTSVSSVDILPSSPSFYFAYLITERGYAIYLHALLKYKLKEKSNIKLIVCNPLPLLLALKNENFSHYGVKEVVIQDGLERTKIHLDKEGKELFIEIKHGLSSVDVQKLYLGSENFVGCRGDRSFSEVVLFEKLFFYDAVSHARPGLHDLCDISTFYLLAYPSLHEYLKCFLDKKTPPNLLGSIIGDLLSDPSLYLGMQKLLSFLKNECLFNPTLVNLVKAKIAGHFNPLIKRNEETLFKEFLSGAHSLDEIIWKKNLTEL